jgi:glutathione S-transferase
VQVPFLVDPNTETRLYESDDIIAYLNETYGAGRRAGWRIALPGPIDVIDSGLASALRLARGTRCRNGGSPAKVEPLVLYNMEGSPYCRKVREALSELDLEHVVKNMPKGTPKRAELVERGGKFQVPYLADPNTDTEMYESDDIIAYLEESYGGRARAGRRVKKTRSRAAGRG